MNDYEIRKQERIDRLRAFADKARQRSEQRLDRADELASMIPMGQPILIGHHSEKGHRAHLKKIDTNMRKGFEEKDKADYYEQKADAAENNTAIASADPEAEEKIKEKIVALEAQQEHYKTLNKILRKLKLQPTENFMCPPESLIILQQNGFTEQEITSLVNHNHWTFNGRNHLAFPSYLFTNTNANIRRLKERLQRLTVQRSAMAAFETIHGPGGYIDKNEDHNGIEVHFPGKPSQEIIDKLKMHGFRWSRFSMCWYGQFNQYKLDIAKRLIGIEY